MKNNYITYQYFKRKYCIIYLGRIKKNWQVKKDRTHMGLFMCYLFNQCNAMQCKFLYKRKVTRSQSSSPMSHRNKKLMFDQMVPTE